MAERLYSLQQTADLLGTSPAEVRRWIVLGRLPAEQMAGTVWVSERGLVGFLTARGIDLSAILGEAIEPEPPSAPSAGADASSAPPADADAASDPPIRPREPDRRDAASRLAEAILHDALRRGADAIFLDPVPGSLTLRLRVNGRVREKPRFASHLPRGLGPLLLSRLRAMAHMAEAAGRDAAFSVYMDGRPRPFRLEDRPTPHGPGLAAYPLEKEG